MSDIDAWQAVNALAIAFFIGPRQSSKGNIFRDI
jgi:hypothetical protein